MPLFIFRPTHDNSRMTGATGADNHIPGFNFPVICYPIGFLIERNRSRVNENDFKIAFERFVAIRFWSGFYKRNLIFV
jgi:hypothetical protein